MRMQGFLTRAQVEMIHRSALRVLAEAGVKVEHAGVRQRLTAIGGRVDDASEIVRFPAAAVEKYIGAAPKRPMGEGAPRISGRLGIYACRYLDPWTNELLPFDEDRLARYIGLARSMKHIEGMGMLGVPFAPEGIPMPYLPLAERLYAWKYGIGCASVLFTGLGAPILEMCACHAQASGKKLEDIFSAVGYLISPLRLARPECEQLLFFAERGLRMGIGHLPSQGGTAPVSLAGAIVLGLAEQMFLFLLRRAFWEDVEFRLGGDVSTLDMRTGALCYGRPEQQRINAAFADLARFYGCSCYGHTGNSDARVPSCEAGVQKAIGALFTALTVGAGSVSEGLLGVDEICSPVQMVLDDDLAGSLKALLAGATVNDAECAVDEILAAGPGGTHLGTDFTARLFREALFEPRTWSAGLTSAWLASGRKTDVDKAREIVAQFERSFAPQVCISPEEERDLRAIIARAVRCGKGRDADTR